MGSTSGDRPGLAPRRAAWLSPRRGGTRWGPHWQPTATSLEVKRWIASGPRRRRKTGEGGRIGRGEARSESNVYGDVQVFDSECMSVVEADPQVKTSKRKPSMIINGCRWLRLELEACMMEAYLVYHARLRAAPSLGDIALNAPAELPFPAVYSDRVSSLVGAQSVAPGGTFSALLTSPSSKQAPSPGSGTRGGGTRPRLSADKAPPALLAMATLPGAPKAAISKASADPKLDEGHVTWAGMRSSQACNPFHTCFRRAH